MSSPVEQIKERLGIVDIVSKYIKLEKAGSNYRARCPFHTEKTPSFFVSPSRNTYHCFGCDNGGDIFSFVEEMEGVDFKGALRILAEKAGVELRVVNKKEEEEKDRLYGIMEEATLFFQIELTKNKEALSYLYKRGLKSGTLKKWRVGFAPDLWTSLHDFLKKKSYTDSEMEKAGLLISKEGGGRPYDRFRGRIMFPIFDAAGRIVAFSGRIFGKEDPRAGKYINSPETALYRKSEILYGYDKAKEAIRKERTCIVVEGQMDLLASHQSGAEYTVALSGTALTPSHIRTIKRGSLNIVFAFDADEAGMKALYKSAAVSLSQGISVEVIDIPEGNDPADIAFVDPERWNSLIKEKKNIITYLLHYLKWKEPDAGNFRRKAGEVVLPLLKRIDNKIIREHFAEETAHALSVSKEAVLEEIGKIETQEDEEIKETHDLREKKNPRDRKEILENQIISIMLWQENLTEPEIAIDATARRISDFSIDFLEKLNNAKKEKKEEMIFEAEQYFEGRSVKDEIEILIFYLKKEMIKGELREESLRLHEAEKNGDAKKISEILKRYQELSRQLND